MQVLIESYRIELGDEMDGDIVGIEACDTGHGMDADLLDRFPAILHDEDAYEGHRDLGYVKSIALHRGSTEM